VARKVQAQTGTSLGDAYDVVGSSVAIDTLEDREVHLVHEMGSTIFSERLSGSVVVLTTGAIAQSIVFDLAFGVPPFTPRRLYAVTVIADVSGRTAQAQVSIGETTPGAEQDVPIWSWASGAGDDIERIIRIQMRGGAVANRFQLASGTQSMVPNMLIGTEQPFPVEQVHFRGISTAFGAGTVTIDAIIYTLFPGITGTSSRGLPLPGW